MSYELELTKSNRLLVARAFRLSKRVDFSIECVIEGQMGRVFADDPAHPTAFCLRTGPFDYFAGETRGPGGYQLMLALPAYHILMPSPAPWLDLAREIYGDDLKSFPRYSLSSSGLSVEHLAQVLAQSTFRERVTPITLELATAMAAQPESYLDLSQFDSVSDFVGRGLGYTILDQGRMIGAAFSSLVCSQGIELSVYVEETYRQQGAATALCSKLLLDCLRQDLRPNWDAANPESVRLAQKLGYRYLEHYDAYYHTRAG